MITFMYNLTLYFYEYEFVEFVAVFFFSYKYKLIRTFRARNDEFPVWIAGNFNNVDTSTTTADRRGAFVRRP